ncbi:MAG: ESS family glutamate:Na+ symporter [Mariniblastus sp.]|jgi:ESS family glutamate:Na+ symporter
MTPAFLFVAVLLMIGVVMRQSFGLFKRLYIPASVVAGGVGLLVFQLAVGFGPAEGMLELENSPGWTGGFSDWCSATSTTLSRWPGWLIAVIFAGMLLERKTSSARESARRVGQQGLMVWIIVLGETAIGLLATWLIVQSFYDVPNSMGMLIETGFAGGHGTAAAMGEVFAHPTVNLIGGKDLGMLMATFGLVYGIVSGILWINVGVRRGWVSKRSLERDTGEGDRSLRAAIGFSRIDRDTVDPLLFQVILLTIAFGLGLAMQFAVMGIAGVVDGWFEPESVDAARAQLSKRLTVSNVVDFPLFIYTLFGGLFVSKTLAIFGQAERVDTQTINRLTSMAMDVLVVAAIASLNLQAVVAMAVPFSILFVCGAIWTAVCLLLVARWILPKEHWFQLGLINYGMSTGTTATGFVLLRMVDPELDSGAAEDYALAAPLSAPFIGGGMITIALPLLLLERVSIAIPALVIAGIVVVLIVVGRKLFYEPSG